ncbi:MAG: hypothetical protein DI586_10450 [Micavibrio aeruginosavorus]|uniref:Uncharacterized protein n=1 Tax=Micavibrio aeruginosavorus TaxID=349221 RepID=A0A2W5H7N0_9BACT|nr:MAG: hypothetical protein DI586_10450 [Micavibrio aeruginosavorus]
MASKTFDIRRYGKYLSGQSADDMNRFLEKLPQNAGNTVLIAAGIAWAAVAALGLFSMLQTQQLTKLRGELQSSESLKPIVPTLTMTPAAAEEVTSFAEKAKTMYPGLTVTANGNILTIQSKDTSAYAQLREIMGHVVSGGAGWKVGVNSFCVGRECSSNAIDASLRIEKVNIAAPVVEAPAESSGADEASESES